LWFSVKIPATAAEIWLEPSEKQSDALCG
jgi:hypothetical protein